MLAPTFTLPNQNGDMVSLEDYRGQKVVLYFYPKDATPGCTTEACDFRDAMPKLNGAVVIGISQTARRNIRTSSPSTSSRSICSSTTRTKCRSFTACGS